MTCIQKEEGVKRHKYSDYRFIIVIPDKLWDQIKMILPKEKPSRIMGRPVIPYRKVPDGMFHVLRTGCQWNMLPKEYSLGSTCHG